MLFFDLDGTITDSNGLWMQVDEEFLGRRGIPCTEEYRQYIAHCIFDTAAAYTKSRYSLPESEEQIKAEWLELARERYAKVALKPGAGEYIRKCQSQGRRMAVVTSCMKELLESALKIHGLLDCFEFVVYANDLKVEKRLPDAFLHAAALGGAEPEDCVMHEDSPVSAAGAKAAGMRVVGVYDDFFASRRAEMEALCDRYIESFLELL